MGEGSGGGRAEEGCEVYISFGDRRVGRVYASQGLAAAMVMDTKRGGRRRVGRKEGGPGKRPAEPLHRTLAHPTPPNPNPASPRPATCP